MSKARNIADLLDSNGDVQASSLDSQPQLGRRNLIINGGFDVWQRGTSFSSIGNGQYCADRMMYSRANTVDVARVACSVDGFKYAARQTNVSEGSCTHYHKIENSGQFYAGQTVTLSFWARASEVLEQRTGRCYSTSGYVTGYDVISLSTDWQRFTVTQTINSAWTGAEPSLDVQVLAGNGTLAAGTWIEITGVQLELGSVATPFEHRSYGEELALCQRYYEKSYDQTHYPLQATTSGIRIMNTSTDGGGASYNHISFKVEKRAAPSIQLISHAGGIGEWQGNSSGSSALRDANVNAVTTSSVYFNIVVGGGFIPCQVYGHFVADAEL